jgi:CRP/FNR family transcriptional regulator, cyclic AMP receptor protein
MELIAETPRRSATVTALEEAETFAVYRAEFDRLRDRHRGMNELLLRFLTNEVRMLDERLLEALFLPVEKRVRRRLVELVGLYPAGKNGIEITLTQEDLAELAGATRATVNQILRDEEKRGTIELQRGKTRIVDLGELARRAR